MFPKYLYTQEKITWDEYVKRKNLKAEKAFHIYRVIKDYFVSKNQELPDGVAYFSEAGWDDMRERAMKRWKELTDLTFEDWA